MKQLLYTIIFFLSLTSVFSQNNINLDLNEYVRPDFRRYSFDFTPSFFANLNYEPNSLKEFSGGFDFNSSARFDRRKNSESVQSDYTIRPRISLGSSNKSGSDFLIGVKASGFNRFFHKPKQFFIVQGDFDGTFNSDNRQNSDGLNISIRPSVGYGFGRIEYVGNGAHVLRILNMLKDQGQLDAIPDSTVIMELIDLVTELKNQRFFDSRLQRIREMETILERLSVTGTVVNPDYLAFSLISDAYVYENNLNNFSSGRSIEITAGRDMAYSSISGWLTSADAKLSLTYNDYHMVNYKTMTRFYGGFIYNYYLTDFGDRIQNRHFILPNLGFDWIHNPTARTSISWENYIAYNINIERDGQINQDRSDIRLVSSANLAYYLSPQVRIGGNASLRTITELEDNVNRINERYDLSVNASVLYSIY